MLLFCATFGLGGLGLAGFLRWFGFLSAGAAGAAAAASERGEGFRGGVWNGMRKMRFTFLPFGGGLWSHLTLRSRANFKT